MSIQGGDFLGSKIKLEMRGMPGNYGAQRVLVMVDGRPVNEEYQGDVDFRFLGLVGLADPVRPEVPDSIRECYRAGVRPVGAGEDAGGGTAG